MNFQRKYDLAESKHLLEGEHFVLHCHHYNSLLHRAITRTPFLDGKAFIYETVSKTVLVVLKQIAQNHALKSADKILEAASEFYKNIGFGSLDFSKLSVSGGTVIGAESHLATGYLKKWGRQEAPVDDYACGYIGAAWAAAYGKKPENCLVKQVRCPSMGDERSEFSVSVK